MKKDFNNTPKKTWAAPNIEDLDSKKNAASKGDPSAESSSIGPS